MLRLYHALRLFSGSRLTWRSCWRLSCTRGKYQIIERDGFLYVEPR